ncbi:MAG: hypothetical protein N3D71_05175, partial [Burkholderiaceae bacterium]|nr:hypothetical protein [Burkholderiaceae bacterium]
MPTNTGTVAIHHVRGRDAMRQASSAPGRIAAIGAGAGESKRDGSLRRKAARSVTLRVPPQVWSSACSQRLRVVKASEDAAAARMP